MHQQLLLSHYGEGTNHNICTACGEPCDIKDKKIFEKIAEKIIKRMDLKGLDKAYRDAQKKWHKNEQTGLEK